MKYIIFFIMCSNAFAATPSFNLNIKVKNGNNVITPMITVKEKETATVIREKDGKESFVDVVAAEKTDGIHLKFAIGTIENGERLVTATPEMIVQENKLSQFASNNEDEGELSLSVIAKKSIEEETTEE